MNFRIQIGIGVSGSDVEVDGLLQILEAAIAHVGRSGRDIAQRRGFELALVGFIVGHGVSTDIGDVSRIHADSNIMKLVIGEESVLVAHGVTGGTIAFFLRGEYDEPALHSVVDGLVVVSIFPAIERGVAADDGALERSNALLDHLVGNRSGTPGVGELLVIAGIGI